MSDDLVKRLREQPLKHPQQAFNWREEAADEIERLQNLVSKQAQDILTLGQLAGRAAELEARIAALEEALNGLLNGVVNNMPVDRFELEIIRVARAALKGETK